MTPKVVDRKARKLEIAKGALALFAESGFEATSISQIAKAVGVKKGTIYDYFSSKDELVAESLQVWMTEVTEDLQGHLEDITDAKEQLRMFMMGACEAIENPLAMQLTIATTQLMLKQEDSSRYHFVREMLQGARRAMNDLLLAGIAQGTFRAELARDIDKITVNALAYLDGIALHYAFAGKDAFALKEQVEFYTERLLSELSVEP